MNEISRRDGYARPGLPAVRQGSAGEASAKRPYNVGSPGRPVLAGALIVLAAFGGLGGWAATAPLDSAALAPGTVVVESHRKLVQHLDGGVVAALLVRDGARVTEGELLARLDSTEAEANHLAVQQQLRSALARQARLKAEQAGATTVQVPNELADVAWSDAHTRQAMAVELAQFEERRAALAGRAAIQRQKIAQLQERIRGLDAQRQSNVRQVVLLGDELVGLRDLYERGYYPRTRILQMERELARLDGLIGEAEAAAAQARNGISEANLQIAQIQQEFREQISRERSEIDDRIAELRQRAVVTSAVLARTKVRAPQSGIVQDLAVHTVGGVIRPGDVIMQIIPVQDRLVVDAEVAPRDIDVVAQGQEAEVRMSALSGGNTPLLVGRVVDVSADRFVEPAGGGERAFFRARIEIPPAEIEKLQDHRIQAGMPVEVLISTGEQTVLDYLTRPVTDAMARGFIEN